MTNKNKRNLNFDYRYGFSMPGKYEYKAKKGLSEDVIRMISKIKKEPSWVLDFRLKAYSVFRQKKMPRWGPDLSKINFDNIYYYIRPVSKPVSSWKDLPKEILETYEKIGVPKAERNFLAGVSAQYDSETVYENYDKQLKKQGVIFCNIDKAISQYPKIVKEYLGTLISSYDNKFAALNSAVFSGGSFVYVPKGVHINVPIQAYFRINAQNFGQFERSLIIAEEDSYIHYIEGCTAPIYKDYSFHAGVVEVFIKKRARIRYTSVQNWSKNVYNLVTKRAVTDEDGIMEWIDCNIGSGVNMKYPSVYLKGKNSHGEMLSISLAGKNQVQDAGAKMIHFGKDTSSRIVSKSISKNGGKSSYRGLVQIMPKAENSSVYVTCDALIMDKDSSSSTYPYIRVKSKNPFVRHEATVERLEEEKLFYLESRGVEKQDAEGLLASGFIESVAKELPLEYLIELNKLINLEMEGSVG